MDEEELVGGHGDSGAITLIGTMTLRPGHEQEFLEFATRTAQTVHQSEADTIL